jgi:plasmid stabilization system protein ParE
VSVPVVYRDSARDDALEAALWYDTKSAGLGDRFVALLQRTADRIARHPQSSPEVHKGVRRARLPVFAYRVFYLIERERVVILAVHHPARDVPDFEALLRP